MKKLLVLTTAVAVLLAPIHPLHADKCEIALSTCNDYVKQLELAVKDRDQLNQLLTHQRDESDQKAADAMDGKPSYLLLIGLGLLVGGWATSTVLHH